MLRCPLPAAGTFRVTFEYLDSEGEPVAGEYSADIGTHADVIEDRTNILLESAPRVSQSQPFEGELCPCELVWLKKLPGITYSRHRRYTVTGPIDEPPNTASDKASRAPTRGKG